jgi:hypothetical protein
VLLLTSALAEADPNMKLHIPETFHRGITYELRKQFNSEMWRSRDLSRIIISNTSLFQDPGNGIDGEGDAKKPVRYGTALANTKISLVEPYSKYGAKVCLFAHAVPSHDSAEEVRKNTIFTNVDVEGFIQCTFLLWFTAQLFLIVVYVTLCCV